MAKEVQIVQADDNTYIVRCTEPVPQGAKQSLTTAQNFAEVVAFVRGFLNEGAAEPAAKRGPGRPPKVVAEQEAAA